jgi:hypothetical protein
LVWIVLALALAAGQAWGTQPFWSMEPSTREIDRADSLTGFDVTKYLIELQIDEETHFLSGRVTAWVTAEEDISGIDYELEGGSLAVTELLVNGIESPYTHENGIIHIPIYLSQGSTFTTTVSYAGVPGHSPSPYNIGMLFTQNGVYTLSNPDAGRFWWPSYDHPWDKALVDWEITVREDWLAAANGIRTGITDNGDGTRTHHWHCASPVATYVIGFAAAPYVEFLQQAGGLPIQNFVLAGQLSNAQTDFSNVPAMIDFFSDAFGPYPFEKYGHMVVNMATYAAMEHQTMTTFGAAYLTGDQAYESIVAHELAHQWYGNYVTPITMREVWLKESFATYSEFLWEAHHLGWQEGCDYLRDEIQQYYISWENSNGPHTIFNPEYNLMFAPPTYEKSASVLHMLRLKLGNEDFFEFIRALLATWPNGNLSTEEFVGLAEQISGQDLTQFFRQWIYSPGIPDARLSVFHDESGQVKVIARSLSPTDTRFDLEIPLSIPGSALADSVVVNATSEGQTNYFACAPSDDIAGILLDPNHWVLSRQITQNTLQLATCLPYFRSVDLSWNAYPEEVPVLGYHVFRRILPSGGFERVNAELLTELAFTDRNLMSGTGYEYYVAAVDGEGFISLPSNRMQATPIYFPFDQGFLVVDETRNGNGANISPTDVMVDGFYASVLESFPHAQWDHDLLGPPSLEDLSHHPLVLWHCDDFNDLQLINSLDTIGSYVLSGGRILISGWKYPSVFDSGFKNRFLPGIEPELNNSAVLVSAQSAVYTVLHPDPAKLATPWNGMLPMSYVFKGALRGLYYAEIAGGGTNDGEALAIEVQERGTFALLGFPLYFMLQVEVRGFLEQYLPQLYTPPDPSTPPALAGYPNPCSGTGIYTLKTENAKPQALEIYNLRGQRLAILDNLPAYQSGPNYELTLPPDTFASYPSGIYLIRIKTDKGYLTKKLTILR